MKLLALIATAALASAAGAQDKPKDQAEESARKVKELRKERIATLKKVVDISLKLAQGARLEVWEAMEDRVNLLNAELEAAEKESDRITLYTNAIEELKAYEKLAQNQFEAGRATQLALFKIKAKRLEMEIALEQAKTKEAKEKK